MHQSLTETAVLVPQEIPLQKSPAEKSTSREEQFVQFVKRLHGHFSLALLAQKCALWCRSDGNGISQIHQQVDLNAINN